MTIRLITTSTKATYFVWNANCAAKGLTHHDAHTYTHTRARTHRADQTRPHQILQRQHQQHLHSQTTFFSNRLRTADRTRLCENDKEIEKRDMSRCAIQTNAQQHTTSRSKREREGGRETRETAKHDDNDANGFDFDDFFNSDNDLDQV